MTIARNTNMNSTSITTDRDAVLPDVKSASDVSGNRSRERGSRLWLFFVAAFVLQLAAWTAWFIIAAHHKVAEVPLATPPAHAGH
jgi:hypothetical protein